MEYPFSWSVVIHQPTPCLHFQRLDCIMPSLNEVHSYNDAISIVSVSLSLCLSVSLSLCLSVSLSRASPAHASACVVWDTMGVLILRGVLQYHMVLRMIWEYRMGMVRMVRHIMRHVKCHIPRLSSRCRCRSNMYQCTAVVETLYQTE